MELYEDNNNIFDVPATDDNSLDLQRLLKLFSCRYRPYLKSTINKYLFSCGSTDWLCIVPIRTKYRLIGYLSFCPSPPLPCKVTTNFVEYAKGDFNFCLAEYKKLCLACLLH